MAKKRKDGKPPPDRGGQKGQFHLKEPFLAAMRQRLFITQACESVGIARSTIYEWRDHDPEFKRAMEEIDARTIDLLRSEAFRRGVVGVDEPIFHMGKQVATTKKYSDYLLDRMLRAKDPAFRDSSKIDVNVNFISVLVGKLHDIVERVVPIKCPSCLKLLSARKDMARELAMLHVIDANSIEPKNGGLGYEKDCA